MSLFVMADLHLSLSVNKPMDIFGGWKDYMQKIEENWQKKNQAGGYCGNPWGYILGYGA